MSNPRFHVYIIESPSAPDLYHRRFEGEALMKTLELSGIPSSYRLTVNKDAFQASFYYGIKEYFQNQSNPLPPIVHISAHGNGEGIQLTSGDVINWDTLREFLIPLNKVFDDGLLLSLSSCNGASGCAMSMKDDSFPFLAIIGNNGTPTWSETNIAYASFYHRLANGTSVLECVEAMKSASGNKDFVIISSEEARKAYLEVIKKEQALSAIRTEMPTESENSLIKKL